jgi:hypothetical protein
MDERKNFSRLTAAERKRVIAAIKWMKNNDKAGTSTTGGLYQNYVNFHAFGSISKPLNNFKLTLPGAPTSILHSIVIDDEERESPSKQRVTKTGLETFFNTEIRISGGGNATGDPFNEITITEVAPSFTIDWNSSPFDKIKLNVTPSGSTTPTTLDFTSSPVTPARTFEIVIFNLAHNNPSFLPWHRVFLRLFEMDLQFADKKLGNDGKIALPYWDFVAETTFDEASATSVWHNDNFGGFSEVKIGGTGPDKDELIGKVTGTHFSQGNWKVFPPLLGAPNNKDFLIRRMSGMKAAATFPTKPVIEGIMGLPDFRSPTPGPGGGGGTGGGGNNRFAGRYEFNVHNPLHGIVGGSGPRAGHMTNAVISPQDPVFFPFHCNIDRLWAIWQINPPRKFNFFPAIFGRPLALKFQYPKFGLLPGRRFNDFMEPWAVKPGGPSTQFNVRVKDVLNIGSFDAAVHATLGTGYTYDDLLTANLTTF